MVRRGRMKREKGSVCQGISEPYSGVKAMGKTWFEQGEEQGLKKSREEGREEGKVIGQKEFLQAIIEKRFGPLSPKAQEKLESWPGDRLLDLGEALWKAHSTQDLGLEE